MRKASLYINKNNFNIYMNSLATTGFQPAISVKEAIRMIHKRELLIPAFQREFVWDAPRVENLFDSIMKGYPISSMLFWKVDSSNFKSFDFYDFLSSIVYGGKNVNTKVPAMMQPFCAVLDGQQRLTALYVGMYGTYAYHQRYRAWEVNDYNFPPRKLYLNLTSTLSDIEGQKTYNFLFLTKENTQDRDLYRDEKGDLWMRVGLVMEIDYITSFCRQNELSTEESKVLEQLQNAFCSRTVINYYLETSVHPSQAVNIFVRINSGGKALSMSDILQSITINGWTHTDARSEFQYLIDKVDEMSFNISHDYILKAFLCLYHSSVKFLINSFDVHFLQITEDNWKYIRDAILNLFRLLQSFGFNHFTLKSYNATLPILCYLYWNNKYNNCARAIAMREDRQVIKHWLIKNILLQSFGSSADSTLQAAIKDLKGQPTFPAELIQNNIDVRYSIDEQFALELLSTQKDNAYAFSILCLLYPDANYTITKFDKDHLHPTSRFEEYQNLGGSKSWFEYNSIVNLQLLEESHNESKGDEYLKDWVTDTLPQRPHLYEETYIPKNVSLDLKDFDAFYEARKQLLLAKLCDALK